MSFRDRACIAAVGLTDYGKRGEFYQGVIVNGGLRFDHINVDTEALRSEPGLADYILCDDDEVFPRYPLDKGVPGGLPPIYTRRWTCLSCALHREEHASAC